MADGSMNDMLIGLNRIIDGQVGPTAQPAPLPVPKRPPAMIAGVELPNIPHLIPENVSRTLAAQLPMAVGGIASMPTALYGLADVGVNYGAEKLGFGDDVHIPGGVASQELTQQIKAPFQEVAKNIAGHPVSEELTSGSPLDIAGAWTNLALQAIPAPAAAYTKLAAGLNKIKSGNAVVDGIGKGLVTAAEVLTPITIAKNPGPAALLNLGVGGAVGVGIESLLPKQEDMNAQAKGATDVAAKGVAEATQAKREITPVQASILPDDPDQRNAMLGIMAAAGLMYWKRKAIYHGLTGIPADESTTLGRYDAATSNLQDKTRPLTASYRTALGNGTNAETLGDEFAGRVAAKSGASVKTISKSVYQYGEIPGSTIKMKEPVDNLSLKVQQLSPDEVQDTINAMNARRELNMRYRIFNQDGPALLSQSMARWMTMPKQMDIAKYLAMTNRGLNEDRIAWGMFREDGKTPIPASELQDMIIKGSLNPKIQNIVDQFNDTTDSLLKYAVERRRITPEEYKDIKRQNPQYFMTELADGASHLGRVKVIAGGGRGKMGDPLKELDNYVDEILRKTRWNEVRREYMDVFNRLAQSGDKNAQKIMGRRVAEGTEHNRDEVVYWRDAQGKQQAQMVNDPLIRAALREGESGAKLHLLGGLMGRMARFFESGAVGPLATVIGAPFAHTAAFYSGMAGGVMRKSGTSAGWIDKGLQVLSQNVVGKRIGLPGDPTFLADALAIRAPLGVSAVIAQRIARAMENSIVNDGVLTKVLSPPTLKAAADHLTDFYKRTHVYNMQQEGMLGPAGLSVDRGQMIEGVFRSGAKHSAPVQAVKDVADFIDDILHAISSSPTASVLAMNKDLSKDKMAHVARDLTGDPGKHGLYQGMTGKAIGTATSWAPWGNIFVQANEKLLRALQPKNLPTTIPGIVMGIGAPQMIATLSNASAGKEYTDYEFHKRTPERMAGYIYVALPWASPEEGLEIPVDPAMRMFKSAFNMMAGAKLGIMDGSFFDPANADMADALKEMAHKKNWDTVGAAAQQAFLPPVPPALGAVAATAGVNLQNYGDARPILENRQRGFTDTTGKDANAKFLGGSVPAQAEAIIRSLGATFGGMVYDTAIGTEKRVDEGKDFPDILNDGYKSYEQRSADSFKSMSGLFGHAMAISPSQDSGSKVLRKKEDKMREIAQAFSATNAGKFDLGGTMVGTTQRGFTRLEGGPIGVAAKDEAMNSLGYEVGKLYSQLVKTHIGPLKDMYANFHSVQNSTQLSPEKKRERLNAIGDTIIQTSRLALTEVERYEHSLSMSYGRWINFDELDLDKPITQFKPLLPN